MDSVTQLFDPALRRAEARVGRVLRDKWRLDRLLGCGGFAAVYAATHARNGKRVAIKLLHPELSAESQIRERFLREGRVANTVGHPGAVAIADDDVAEDGAVFLVMDLLEGETVEARRTRAGGRLDVVDVLSIADQALDVLVAAHGKGVVHRDLKPENLFVTGEGVVKILDFGIARLREGGSSATQSGLTMGTPAFMPPEQARGLWSDVDGRTDLWAIGACMFQCLSGKLVHEGRTPNEILLSSMTKPAPSLRAVAPEIPAPVALVVDRALAFTKDDRFASAVEMQAAIRAAYETLKRAPLSTAPKLHVPDAALQKTLPSSSVGGLVDASSLGARTVEPVSAGRTGLGLLVRTRPAAVGAGVAVTALVLAFAVFMGIRETGRAYAPEGTAADTPRIAAASNAPPSPAPPSSSSSSSAAAIPASALPAASANVEPTAKREPRSKAVVPPKPASTPDAPKPPARKAPGPIEDSL